MYQLSNNCDIVNIDKSPCTDQPPWIIEQIIKMTRRTKDLMKLVQESKEETAKVQQSEGRIIALFYW